MTFIRGNLDRLRAARPWLMSSVKIGKAAGVPQKTVNNLLNARHDPLLSNVEKVAHAFGAEVWELLVPNCTDNIKSVVWTYTNTTADGRRILDNAVEAARREIARQQQRSRAQA